MAPPLRMLLIEDSDDDAELSLRALARGGLDVDYERVMTGDAMRRALAASTWDFILSDYNLPEFSAPEALAILEASQLDIPFLIVSGEVGEEIAVESLRAGAKDFFLKGRLARLCSAIVREVREQRRRAERLIADRAAEQARRERDVAELANVAKTRFLAHMSHELRTPLTAILGFASLLEESRDLSTTHRAYVHHLAHSGRHLLTLINDLLDVSKIEAGRMDLDLQPTSLTATVAQVRDILAPLADGRGVALVVSIADDVPHLSADPTRLRQILYNLVSNGLKFTERRGVVEVRAQRAGERVEVVVRDTGCGIRPEDLQRLFREFEQLRPHEDGARGGTGLGLVLTRHLVELHGGTIEAESTWGQGTTFRVLLPAAVVDAAPVAAEAPAAPISTSRAREVLVVDDDPSSRLLFSAILQGAGHHVVEVASIVEAQTSLSTTRPDLVVTYVHPGCGSERLLSDLRRDPELRAIPVLATTAQAMLGDKERILATGFDAYVSKPVDIAEFLRIVEASLGSA